MWQLDQYLGPSVRFVFLILNGWFFFQTHSAYCTDSGFMLKIKNLMLLFSNTLQSYGFSTDKMYSLLQELRDHYNEVLMQKWVTRFRDIFEADNYHPIQVITETIE